MYYLGIDLGTSGAKFLLVDKDGNIVRKCSKQYELFFPHPGWSEQKPEDWWEACKSGIPELLSGIDPAEISGIGCGGQMHGLVTLDKDDNVIRPAILWNDGRTGKEVEYLNNVIGKDKLSDCTANIAFAGFTAPKILWMKKNEPDNFARIDKIMLPKDYINYKLTGVHACDYSDASGMLLLDVKNRRWSEEMLEICGVTEDMMPKLFESYEPIGRVSDEAAQALGLLAGTGVVAGAGDNAAAAVGTGTVGSGKCNLSVGTSGTLFISSDKFGVDPYNALHSFAHADGNYHLMACMLSAASCNKWMCENILRAESYDAERKDITDDRLGRNHVFFLPYLMGERSPINDIDARATFTGITMDSSRLDLVQAVLEGVAYGIRDSFEIAKSQGIEIKRSNICGGGATSPLWRKIFANVLGIPMDVVKTEQGPGYGAAILAMVGDGLYPSVEAACEALVEISSTTEPDPEITARYNKAYEQYKLIYPALKDTFRKLAEEGESI